ncbi:MAG: transcriptional regulator [Bacteroidetes bacterium]|nr:MAG: transcriptional regulator [Bacteroidota bacterium]RLD74456.1 MAG: transcriptional regulator [Bacteroidota bacterium]
MFKTLNPLLHSQLRLQIISLLIAVESAEFTYLLEKTGATRGNLSVQITKLKEAGYIEVSKSYKNNYPLTTCSITHKGIIAFEEYVKAIKQYINKK